MMKPFCGKKEKFLDQAQISKNCCDRSPFHSPVTCKEPMIGIQKHSPCKYFIVRQSKD